jgi:hypothetical protein
VLYQACQWGCLKPIILLPSEHGPSSSRIKHFVKLFQFQVSEDRNEQDCVYIAINLVIAMQPNASVMLCSRCATHEFRPAQLVVLSPLVVLLSLQANAARLVPSHFYRLLPYSSFLCINDPFPSKLYNFRCWNDFVRWPETLILNYCNVEELTYVVAPLIY